MHATRSSGFTPGSHDSLHVRVGLSAHTAAPRPPLLGSEERRRQHTHRPTAAPHADRCAEAPHAGDVLRRLEARHGICRRTVLCALLLVPNFVDPKRVVEGRDDVAVLVVLAGKTLHQGECATCELANLPAGHDVPHAHRTVVVATGADDLCAVVAELYPGHAACVPRKSMHLQNAPDSHDANA